LQEIFTISSRVKLPCFPWSRCIIHLQIPHGTCRSAYPSKDTKIDTAWNPYCVHKKSSQSNSSWISVPSLNFGPTY
jgi:hypothetical protein